MSKGDFINIQEHSSGAAASLSQAQSLFGNRSTASMSPETQRVVLRTGRVICDPPLFMMLLLVDKDRGL